MAWKAAIVGYGALAYGTSLVVFGYLILFLVGVGVPKGIDDGPAGPVWAAVSVDVAPLILFAVQHSVMARRWFKRWWTRFVAPPIPQQLRPGVQRDPGAVAWGGGPYLRPSGR